ncbi:MAG: VOC family protein [Vicinamibacterales bacterium]
MSANPVGWFEIYVQDIERAKAFYSTVLLRTFDKLESGDLEMWAFNGEMGKPGTGGTLVQMAGMPSGGNSVIVYFNCDDCAVEESRVVAAGGRILKSKFSIGQYGFVALVYDTEGNLIGLHSLK